MTIASELNRVTYVGNGATTAFAVSFPFQSQSDLVVVETIIATGVQTTKTITTHYTISGSVDSLGYYSSGGTVNAVAAPASTVRWTIYRDPARLQSLNLSENNALPAESLEAQLDYVTMLVQRLNDVVGRSLRQPDGDSANIAVLPSAVDRASTYLSFDTSGNPVVAADPAAYPASAFMATVIDDTTALAARTTLEIPVVYVPTVGGTANAITLTPTVAMTAYAAGQRFSFIAANDNTGDTTVAVSGLAAKTIQKTGISGATILNKGDITAPGLIVIEYDGSSFNLLTPSHPQELSWTPSVGGTATYTSRTGRAWRSGMMVFLSCDMTINAIGTGSPIQISGAPYAIYGIATAPVSFYSSATNVISVVAEMAGSTITLNSLAAAAASIGAANNILGNGTTIRFSMTYLTTD